MSQLTAMKKRIEGKSTLAGWILPKMESSWAPPGVRTNIDMDPTPLSRRTWSKWTILGYWFSDVISVQSWSTGSTILAVGLTWKEAVFSIIIGSAIMGLPMTLNGYTGAICHVPFPVLARSSFGYRFAKFPVILRLITALFWHAITNYLAVGPATQVIRAIFPSFRTMKNHLPESAGVTSQAMVAYFLLWTIQFPLLLIPVHKMKWLFLTKTIMMLVTVVGMLIWICVKAQGSGDIWSQRAEVSGSQKAWLTMWALNSCTASWSTVGVNIPDFTRYLNKPRDVIYQGLWFPITCSWIAIVGIVVTSASKTVYGDFLWNPISIIDMWEGPGGRAAAFFCGLSWLLAQMCVNISATVVSGANDLVNLSPKWINVKRGTVLITIIGGWAMVPWKILVSASSLLNFMSSLGIFLAPCMGILCSDFFLVKYRCLDIPALYDPKGRYQYQYGVNWRAVVALAVALGPTLPGLIKAVNAAIAIGGADYIVNFNWYYGIVSSSTVYYLLSLAIPAEETLVPYMVTGSIEGVSSDAVMSEGMVGKEKNIIISSEGTG